MLPETFDAVVVGSGFGGAVTAWKLADAGWKVCLLERGRKWPPGSFARTPRTFRKNFWDPSKKLFGLLDIWSFKKLDAVISSGVGGGSLVYANVLLRKPEKWFVREPRGGHGGHFEYWPVQLEQLVRHYDNVERWLKPTEFPADHEHYRHVVKTQAYLQAGRDLGLPTRLLPLAVTFGNNPAAPVPGEQIHEPEGNLHGLPRSTCRLCGECILGCNYGSKNTLDYNYLSAAQRKGLDLRDLHEVKAIRSLNEGRDGYEIDYVRHYPEQADSEGYLPVRSTMVGRKLILAAGTLGSSFLLLKNRNTLGELSPALGDKVGGNGDMLVFAKGCRDSRNQVRDLAPDLGPTITTAIERPDSLDTGDPLTGRGGYIEDAAIPALATWVGEYAMPWKTMGNVLRFLWLTLRSRKQDPNISYELTKLIGDAELSRSMLPLLCMGRDIADGRFSLNDRGRLECDWNEAASDAFFDGMSSLSAVISDKLGGKAKESPAGLLGRTTTVHPLGGCVMSDNAGGGVVDSFGRVHGLHNLVVADGSVLPGPCGPNPALTIAALADRFAEELVNEGKPG